MEILTNCFTWVHFERIIFLIFKNQSIYFDEPNPARAKCSSPEGLPDWVMGELGSSEHQLSESWKFSSGDSSLMQSPPEAPRYALEIGFQTHLLAKSVCRAGSDFPLFLFLMLGWLYILCLSWGLRRNVGVLNKLCLFIYCAFSFTLFWMDINKCASTHVKWLMYRSMLVAWPDNL